MDFGIVNYPTFKHLANTIGGMSAVLSWASGGVTYGSAFLGNDIQFNIKLQDGNTSIATLQADFPKSANLYLQPYIAYAHRHIHMVSNQDGGVEAWNDFVKIVNAIGRIDHILWYNAGGGVGNVYAFIGDKHEIVVQTRSVINATVVPTTFPQAVEVTNAIPLGFQ